MTGRRLQLETADFVAVWLWVNSDIQVAPATIRKWASRGKITSYGGRGSRGGCYDLQEVQDYARSVRIVAH